MKRLYPFNVGYYLANVNSFSPHNSDTEGTSAYKRLRREMLDERQGLLIKISELKDEMLSLRKTIAERDKQMQSSSSLVTRMGQLNERLKKQEEKLARLQEENTELKNENALKDVALALMEKPEDEILFGQSEHEKREEREKEKEKETQEKKTKRETQQLQADLEQLKGTQRVSARTKLIEA